MEPFPNSPLSYCTAGEHISEVGSISQEVMMVIRTGIDKSVISRQGPVGRR